MLGGAMGMLDGVLFHHAGEPIGAFALVGMGAVFSGIIRAPMTSVLIIIEMTSGYSLILPLMIANMSAYVLARHWRPVPIYEALLEQDGVDLHPKSATSEVEGLRLRQFIGGEGRLRTFPLAAHADEVVRDQSKQDVYPVVDDEGEIVGIISSDELAIVANDPALQLLVNAADLMRPAVSVGLDDDLGTVLQAMLSNGLSQLPVTDAEGHCVGVVSEADIARAVLRAQRPKSLVDAREANA
jgi:CIC family chloride channel protein